MDLAEKDLQKLSSHPLFRETSASFLHEALALHGRGGVAFSDGESLCSPEETAHALGFLLKGRAVVHTTDESRTVLLRFLGADDVFGIAGLFSGEAPVSRITASGACRCVLFSEEAVSYLLEKDASFRKNYIGFLTGRIRFLNRKIEYLTAGSAERRLALYLASLGDGRVRLQDSITSLSDLLNLGRASLYRAFDRLCQDGYLIKNGRDLILTDTSAMLDAYK